MKRTLPILILSALLLSCVSEDCTPTRPTTPEPTNSSPDSLIMAFVEAYASRDSSAYSTLLDSSYTFWNAPREIAGELHMEWWDLDEELIISGRMFSGWENDSGTSVLNISLDLIVTSNTVDDTPYPEKPPGETWRKIITSVDMSIRVDDPGNDDGIMDYIVLSEEIFIVRPDPLYEGLWIVYRQEDQPFVNKGGTLDTRWGDVKQLFR